MKYVITGLKFVVAVGLFALLFRIFNIRASALVTEIKDWRYVVGAVFLSLTIVPFISTRRWQLFLRFVGVVESSFSLWSINLKALFQGLIIPSTQGSDILRIYYIDKRNPNRRGHAGSTVLVERMLGFVLLCLLSIVAILSCFRSREFVALISTAIAINATVFVIFGLILSKKIHGFYSGHKFECKTIARVFDYIDTLHGAIVYFPYRKILPSSLVWIVAYQFSIVAVIFLAFGAYGYTIPFVQHLAIYPVIAILSLAPITIGGFGVREGLFVFFYSLIGVPPAVAVCVSVLQYIILILLPASLGGFLFLWESVSNRER